MAARDDADIVALPEFERRDRRGEGVAHGVRRFREARRGGKVRPVVHHGHVKIQHSRHAAERLRDIAAAEQDQPLIRAEAAHKLRALRLEMQRRCKAVLRAIPYGLKLL